MARSFKHTPGWCDRNPKAKKLANRRVRRYKGNLSDGCEYRKLSEPYDICDYTFLYHTPSALLRESEEVGGRWTPRVFLYRARMK